MNRKRWLTLTCTISLSLGACTSSHNIPLTYLGSDTAPTDQIYQISLGQVEDSRPNSDQTLGTIRGGYGNPLKRLYFEKSPTRAVGDVLEAALQSNPGFEIDDQAEMRLDASLERLDTNYYFNKEAHAKLSFSLVHAKQERVVFTETYQTDLTKGGAGAGIFANVQALGEYANEALSQTINKLLSDGKFLKELKNQPQASGASGTPNERLLQLESLKNEGLITESEYSEKRRKILQEL